MGLAMPLEESQTLLAELVIPLEKQLATSKTKLDPQLEMLPRHLATRQASQPSLQMQPLINWATLRMVSLTLLEKLQAKAKASPEEQLNKSLTLLKAPNHLQAIQSMIQGTCLTRQVNPWG